MQYITTQRVFGAGEDVVGASLQGHIGFHIESAIMEWHLKVYLFHILEAWLVAVIEWV
jgi:hypothetical protein